MVAAGCGDHGHVGDAELGGDIGVGAAAVDAGGAVDGDLELAGALGQERALEALRRAASAGGHPDLPADGHEEDITAITERDRTMSTSLEF